MLKSTAPKSRWRRPLGVRGVCVCVGHVLVHGAAPLLLVSPSVGWEGWGGREGTRTGGRHALTQRGAVGWKELHTSSAAPATASPSSSGIVNYKQEEEGKGNAKSQQTHTRTHIPTERERERGEREVKGEEKRCAMRFACLVSCSSRFPLFVWLRGCHPLRSFRRLFPPWLPRNGLLHFCFPPSYVNSSKNRAND